MAKNQILVKAAIAGLMGASAMVATAAFAANPAPGHCMGANSCKGKGACAVDGQNSCKGQNTCKGKSYLETTKAKCDAMAKTNKNIKFVAASESGETKTK
jgi:hypothetical protein